MPDSIKGHEKEISCYLGLELLWDDKGYQTLVRGIYFGEDIPNDHLEEICFCLAKRLDTEVAIGGDDAFIVYTPSGERWFAEDACEEGYFELIRIT